MVEVFAKSVYYVLFFFGCYTLSLSVGVFCNKQHLTRLLCQHARQIAGG